MHTVQGDKLKQETVRAEKYYTNMDSISKSNNKTKPMVESRLSKTIEYLLQVIISKNRTNYNLEDKLLPVYNMASSGL